ncbi:hypothetical protein FWH13_03150 [Candidatus Saccharibacteria bacterium]|nr:hypothetical protein [Candidatus Saccharibacteria bacterium]
MAEQIIGQISPPNPDSWNNLTENLTEYIPQPENPSPKPDQFANVFDYRDAIGENVKYRDSIKTVERALAHFDAGEAIPKYQAEAVAPLLDQYEHHLADTYKQSLDQLIHFSSPLEKGYGNISPLGKPVQDYAHRNLDKYDGNEAAGMEDAMMTLVEADYQLDLATAANDQPRAAALRTVIFSIVPQRYSLDVRDMSNKDYQTYLNNPDQNPALEQKYRRPAFSNLSDYIRSQSSETSGSYTMRDGKTDVYENTYRISTEATDALLDTLNTAKTQSATLDRVQAFRATVDPSATSASAPKAG